MIPTRPNTPWRLWGTSRIVLLCAVQCSSAATAEPRQAGIASPGSTPSARGGRGADLKFTHLTTNDGLSQGYVVDILQDRRGFMWFATRDGLNRYDGYTFVVYKHDPNDPGSLSSNFIQDLMEDDQGYLWVATNNGVNRFDPTTERCHPLPPRPQRPRHARRRFGQERRPGPPRPSLVRHRGQRSRPARSTARNLYALSK